MNMKIEIVSCPRPDNQRTTFIRESFKECPVCAAKSGSPALCVECLERRELFSRFEKQIKQIKR